MIIVPCRPGPVLYFNEGTGTHGVCAVSDEEVIWPDDCHWDSQLRHGPDALTNEPSEEDLP